MNCLFSFCYYVLLFILDALGLNYKRIAATHLGVAANSVTSHYQAPLKGGIYQQNKAVLNDHIGVAFKDTCVDENETRTARGHGL